MKVLVLYHFVNQKNLMHNYAVRLKQKGIGVDAICVDTLDYDHCSKLWWPFFLVWASFFIGFFKIFRLDKHFKSFILYHFLPRFYSRYDLIDFNAYYWDYTDFVKKCITIQKKFVVTLWGSDLMRADEEQLKVLEFGLDNCSCIKLTDSLFEVLRGKFGNKYDEKCRITYFGNSDLEAIDSMNRQECVTIKKELYGENSDKIIVVCGYNAIESQNHKTMITALSEADPGLFDKCLFVFPMTYGWRRYGYDDEVQSQLSQSRLKYIILDKFLEIKYLAVLRMTADIVVNIQSTDAISASLQDHLYCGNVCIIGEWLHYKPYDDNSIFYLKCKKDNLTSIFEDVCSNLAEYKKKCRDNHTKIGVFFSWANNLEKIADVYQSLVVE